MTKGTKNIRVFLIAGEASGDLLGSRLMKALKQQIGRKVEIIFAGVGGPTMIAEGLDSLFPMHDLSVMGIVEVLPKLPRILWRMAQTVRAAKLFSPDLIVTIDSPDFNFRVIKRLQSLRKKGIKCVHYNAPTVWAYRPKRAKKISKLYDHLLVLFPFEPPYFTKWNLPTTFVGHPIVEKKLSDHEQEAAQFRKRYNIGKSTQVITMMPGSRESEVSRLLPIFAEVVTRLHERGHNFFLVIPSVGPVFDEVAETVEKLPVPGLVIGSDKERDQALAASRVALVKSGTSALELAHAGVPMIVTYKLNALSAEIAKRVLMIDYVTIINIIMEREVIPEYLQEKCDAKLLTDALEALLQDTGLRDRQLVLCKKVMEKLGQGASELPSQKAAATLLRLLKK